MFNRLIPLLALLALTLVACDKTPSETSKDVRQAREEASQDVSETRQDASETMNKAEEKVVDAQQDYAKSDASARAKLTEAESQAMVTKAKADFDVTIAEAEGRHAIEIEKCGALEDVSKKACLSTANATFEADKAAATAKRDAALVEADQYR
jgi:light-regulated signal transduction histidine kinase (bacteriophytochrome)